MLVMNNQKRTVHVGSLILLPGSNIVKDGAIDESHPVIRALSDAGKLVFERNVTQAVAAMAIPRASTKDVLEQIQKAVKKPSESLKKAAAARKTELEEFDAEWEEARKKQQQAKEAGAP